MRPTPSPPKPRRSPASRKVLTIANAANAHALAQVLAPQIAKVAAGYTHVLGPSTTFGKDLMPCVAALLGVAQVSDVMAVEDSAHLQAPDLCRQRDHHRRRRRPTKPWSPPCAPRRGRPPAAAAAPAIEAVSVDASTADAHALRRTAAGQERSPRPAERAQGRLRRPRARLGRCVLDHLFAGRQDGRRGRRLARRGRRRLRAQRIAGRPDRQDHLARAVRRDRHFRRDPAPDRHQGRGHHRRHQQGRRRADLRDRRLSAWSATCSRSCRSWKKRFDRRND